MRPADLAGANPSRKARAVKALISTLFLVCIWVVIKLVHVRKGLNLPSPDKYLLHHSDKKLYFQVKLLYLFEWQVLHQPDHDSSICQTKPEIRHLFPWEQKLLINT